MDVTELGYYMVKLDAVSIDAETRAAVALGIIWESMTVRSFIVSDVRIDKPLSAPQWTADEKDIPEPRCANFNAGEASYPLFNTWDYNYVAKRAVEKLLKDENTADAIAQWLAANEPTDIGIDDAI